MIEIPSSNHHQKENNCNILNIRAKRRNFHKYQHQPIGPIHLAHQQQSHPTLIPKQDEDRRPFTSIQSVDKQDIPINGNQLEKEGLATFGNWNRKTPNTCLHYARARMPKNPQINESQKQTHADSNVKVGEGREVTENHLNNSKKKWRNLLTIATSHNSSQKIIKFRRNSATATLIEGKDISSVRNTGPIVAKNSKLLRQFFNMGCKTSKQQVKKEQGVSVPSEFPGAMPHRYYQPFRRQSCQMIPSSANIPFRRVSHNLTLDASADEMMDCKGHIDGKSALGRMVVGLKRKSQTIDVSDTRGEQSQFQQQRVGQQQHRAIDKKGKQSSHSRKSQFKALYQKMKRQYEEILERYGIHEEIDQSQYLSFIDCP